MVTLSAYLWEHLNSMLHESEIFLAYSRTAFVYTQFKYLTYKSCVRVCIHKKSTNKIQHSRSPSSDQYKHNLRVRYAAIKSQQARSRQIQIRLKSHEKIISSTCIQLKTKTNTQTCPNTSHYMQMCVWLYIYRKSTVDTILYFTIFIFTEYIWSHQIRGRRGTLKQANEKKLLPKRNWPNTYTE